VLAEADTIAGMREKCRMFWAHVTTRVAPAPSNLDEIQALYKQFRGTRVELDDATYALFERRFERLAERNKAAAAIEELDYQIGSYIHKAWGTPAECNAYDGPEYERAVLVYGGHQVGSWNRQSRATLNAKALKASFPDIAKAYTQTSYFRVMRRKETPK
jgi:hypothetical protein